MIFFLILYFLTTKAPQWDPGLFAQRYSQGQGNTSSREPTSLIDLFFKFFPCCFSLPFYALSLPKDFDLFFDSFKVSSQIQLCTNEQ
jgi:hypothetical protein